MGSKADKLAAIAKSPEQLNKIARRFTVIVHASMVEDRARAERARVPFRVTDAEVKRRTNVLYDWFIVMRAELGYSTERALDTLPTALRKTLDGDRNWLPPPPERAWAPPR